MNTFKYYMILIMTLFLMIGCSTSPDKNKLPTDNDTQANQELEINSETTNEAGKKIIIASMENKPYKTIVDGKLTGPYIDIIMKALDNLGYDYEIQIMPWNRVVESVEKGTIDIGFSFFDTPDRRKFAYYMQEPIGIYNMNVFTMPNSKVKFDGSLDSIKSYDIGLVQNYFYTNEIQDAIKNTTLTSEFAIDTPNNIAKLINGRVDLIIEDNFSVDQYLKSNAIDIELKKFEKNIVSNYSYLVFPKNKDYDELRLKLDEEFKSMKLDGSFYQIYENYGLEDFAEAFKNQEKNSPPPKKYFWGYNTSPLRIGVISNTKPYTYIENGHLTGFIIDYLSEALDRIGVKYEFTQVPFTRMLEELKNGSLDIGTDIYYNKPRSEFLIYPKDPFIEYPTVFFKDKDLDFTFDGDFEELKSYKIGYVRDYYIGPLDIYKDDESFNFFASNTNKQNFENLAKGRIDLALDIKSTGENILNNFDENIEIISIEPPVFLEYSYITFSKANELDLLLSEYELSLESMKNDGTLKNIYDKYNLKYFDYNIK